MWCCASDDHDGMDVDNDATQLPVVRSHTASSVTSVMYHDLCLRVIICSCRDRLIRTMFASHLTEQRAKSLSSSQYTLH